MRYCICKIKSTSAAATSHFFWTAKCKMPQLDAAIVVKCSAGYMLHSSPLPQLQLLPWLRQHLQTCALAFLAINFSQPTQRRRRWRRRRQQPTGNSQQSYCNKISCRCLEPSRNCSAFGFLGPPRCDRKMKLVLHTLSHTHTLAHVDRQLANSLIHYLPALSDACLFI